MDEEVKPNLFESSFGSEMGFHLAWQRGEFEKLNATIFSLREENERLTARVAELEAN